MGNLGFKIKRFLQNKNTVTWKESILETGLHNIGQDIGK